MYVRGPLGWITAVAVGVGVAFAAAQPATKPAPASTQQPSDPPKKPNPEMERLIAEANKGEIRHGVREAIAKPTGAIRFATYNIENLFDTPSGGDEESRSGTEAKPIEHRKAVAEAIRRIDADVLAVQEIESVEVLTKFRDEYLKDMGYTHVASIDAGDPRGIEQSVLSRFPLRDPKVWKNLPLVGVQPAKLGNRNNRDAGKPLVLKRSPFKVTVDVPTGGAADGNTMPIIVLSVHHKSGPYHSFQREAESARVSELVKELQSENAGAGVIVMGDFNAKAEEKALQTYFSSGMADAMAGLDPKKPAHMSHVSGRDIDHILLTPNLASALNKETRFILGTTQRPEKLDWRTTPPPVGYAADHYPVVVDLMLVK